jgi:hypothetical protein
MGGENGLCEYLLKPETHCFLFCWLCGLQNGPRLTIRMQLFLRPRVFQHKTSRFVLWTEIIGAIYLVLPTCPQRPAKFHGYSFPLFPVTLSTSVPILC